MNLMTHAPEGWLERGFGDVIPDACKCHQCGYVGPPSLFSDFYADAPGLPLSCERCMQRDLFKDAENPKSQVNE